MRSDGIINVAIVGCGMIGQKRARTLKHCRLVACVDQVFSKAEALAAQFPDATAYSDWREVIQLPTVDMVVVATLHASLAEISLAAVTAGKHVMLEKPGARRAMELEPVSAAAKKTGALVRVGFNHRYHRAFQEARRLVDSGVLGELMFLRARYGHGGRIGYDREWRAQPELSGGGELIDQGVHLIDLARWFLGDFAKVEGCAGTWYWDMPVDDNGFLLLRTESNQVAFLHASCTEWKNTFSFELYGRHGKIDINGLGGSYGVERLAFYRMLPEMGPPETRIMEYPMQDNSWDIEMAEFLEDIRQNRTPAPGIVDAQAALRVVEHIYKGSCQ